jgi:hypothetical protein
VPELQHLTGPDPDDPAFRPPHCPNRKCVHSGVSDGWRYVRTGFRQGSGGRGKRIQRYRCRTCGRCFSTRTFSATYWLRRPELLPQVALHAVEGCANRQTARILGVSHATVGRYLSRAGRHCMLAHQLFMRGTRLKEPIVIDGFESFEHSQFFPFNINVAAGRESWMLYGFTDSPLRRKGRMTAQQKRRRAELEAEFGRPDPKAAETGMVDLLRPLLPLVPEGEPLRIHSDDHRAYPRAFRRLAALPSCPKIEHEVTSSKERRTTSNPLFPVNLTDMLLRHGQAGHRRETIAFCKRRQGSLERAAIFLLWRNYIKQRRENHPGETAAMKAGVVDRAWSFGEIFRRRLFPRASLLPPPWRAYYGRRIKTAVLGADQTTHRLRYPC